MGEEGVRAGLWVQKEAERMSICRVELRGRGERNLKSFVNVNLLPALPAADAGVPSEPSCRTPDPEISCSIYPW